MENIQNARLIEYGKCDKSYGTCMADLAIKFMPPQVFNKFAVDSEEADDAKLTRCELLSALADIIPNVVPKEYLQSKISELTGEYQMDLEEAYRLLTVESLIETSEEVRVNLIAEADTQEKVQNNIKDLGDILKKDNIPNIIQTIAKTVSKEIQKSNQEMNDIETKETELVLSTTPEGEGDGGEQPIDPFNILDDGGVPEPDDSNNTQDNPENNGDANTSDNQTQDDTNSEGEPEEETSEIPEEISGDEGELYSEAIRNKYAEALNSNIVYRIKNAVSKSFYKMSQEGEVNPKMTNLILGVAYGLIVFGYMLVSMRIITPEEYSSKVEVALAGDENDNN